jgi:hypothetical protein
MRINLVKMNEELQYLKNWKVGFFFDSFPIKKAQRILTKSKKKTNRLCAKYNKVLFSCKYCKGSGFEHFHDGDNFIKFARCKKCDSVGALTWIDKMTGGWKNCIM